VLAAAACAWCLASPRRMLRLLGGYLVLVTVIYSSTACASGFYSRLNDPRDATLHYVRDHIAGRCTYAYGDPDGGSGDWLYPTLDADRFTKAALREAPDLILVDRTHFDKAKSVFDGHMLNGDYSLTEQGVKHWAPDRIQPPEYFRLFRDLIDDGGRYELVRSFDCPKVVRPEYSSFGILVYAREDRLVALGLKAVADDSSPLRPCPSSVLPCGQVSDPRPQASAQRPAPAGASDSVLPASAKGRE